MWYATTGWRRSTPSRSRRTSTAGPLDSPFRRPGSAALSFEHYLLKEFWRHIRYIGRLLSEFYRFQYIVFEIEVGPMLGEKQTEWRDKLHGIGDWARRTFGKRMTRRWLNAFWMRYAQNRWHLLLNPWTWRWHVKMLPFAFTEFWYTLRFATMLSRMVKTTKQL